MGDDDHLRARQACAKHILDCRISGVVKVCRRFIHDEEARVAQLEETACEGE
jgi:hypothetical protein